MQKLPRCSIFVFCCFLILTWKVCAQDKSQDTPLKVMCPPFDNSSRPLRVRESNTEYCICKLSSIGLGRTAVIKCDFDFLESVILTNDLFNFIKWNTTSAYIRMSNSKSIYVASSFLNSWMDSPSSALDLWHCGQVNLEATPTLHSHQKFPKLKTFIGVGLVGCNISSIPPYFLRERSRAALRIKDCNVGNMKRGLLHKIHEIRYLVIENSKVKQVEGPLSSSGVIQLSRKSIHTWNGFQLINSSIDIIKPYAFNFTHKSDTEDFKVYKSELGNLGMGAISAKGDIKVEIINNSFASLGPQAFKIAVNAPLIFNYNTIKVFGEESLKGIECLDPKNTSIEKNTFYVSKEETTPKTLFEASCLGSAQISYFVSSPSALSLSQAKMMPVVAISLSLIFIVIVLFAVATWLWRKGLLRRYTYKKQDQPLFREEVPEILE